MEIRFQIHYNTVPGEQIGICGSSEIFGNWNASKSYKMHHVKDGYWIAEIKLPKSLKELEYKYILVQHNGNIIWEWGTPRNIKIPGTATNKLFLKEHWRSPANEEKVMYSSAFTKVIMKPDQIFQGDITRAKRKIEFRITAPRVGKRYQLCVSGNQKSLGNWDKSSPLLLSSKDNFPVWSGEINASGIEFPLNYKYGIFDVNKKEIVTFESGFDRQINEIPDENEFHFIQRDESFRYPLGNWKGAGVAVPVFALRSENGFGIGEFNDLIDFIDWAKSVDLRMVQVLPVNETVASHSWLDSYPYKSISVIALHPVYLNIRKMGLLKDKKLMAEFERHQKNLNNLTHVDYPEVHRIKSKYYKLIFDQEKETFFELTEYKLFFEKNKEWLVPYAAFAYLRDKMKSPDFRTWNKYSEYNQKDIEKLSQPGSNEWDDISIHYYLQYHLDKQLKEVSEHARKNGIVLKGDIPIGISPNSHEAWTDPHLFNLNAQAGAPPDSFAVKGQNWGFPTYNWEKMSTDNYAWWRRRLHKMSEYFDAYRIDHILGFFRIWEIPVHAVEGILGAFNPALPLSAKEIESYGLHFDYERMVKPYIRHNYIVKLFGAYADEVISTFLENTSLGMYKTKEEFDCQVKVNRYFLKNVEEEELNQKDRLIRDGLFDLLANVLFVQTGYDQYHPRITLQLTNSFEDMDETSKFKMNEIYNHFFFKRHDEFWYHKAMEKLPAIIEATNMLVCGEDLGMVPDCVHPVMNNLCILRLDIQRMSKKPELKFAHPADAPYLSVCTTSTHDMSTIRGWWEEDRKTTQEFYNEQLGNQGEAPYFAEPWICKQIIRQHVHSPAMWTTFPIQDLIAMDSELRWEMTHLEKINEPSNVRHKWRYRMQQSIEMLKKADSLNEIIKSLIHESGRNSEY